MGDENEDVNEIVIRMKVEAFYCRQRLENAKVSLQKRCVISYYVYI